MKTTLKTIFGILLMCFAVSSVQATNIKLSVKNVKQNGMLLLYEDLNGNLKRQDFDLVNGKASLTVNEPIEKYTLFTLVFKGFTSKDITGYVYPTIVKFYGSDNTDLTINVKGVNEFALAYTIKDNLDNDINKRLMAFNEVYNKTTADFMKYSILLEQLRKKATPEGLEGKEAIIAANKVLKKDPEYLKLLSERNRTDSGSNLTMKYIKENTDLLSSSFLWHSYSVRMVSDQEAETLVNRYPADIQAQSYCRLIKDRLQKRKDSLEGNAVKPLKGTLPDGSAFDMSTIVGKKYILIDFYGTWCGPCMKGMPHMSEFYHKHKDNLEMVSVCCNDKENKWRAFLDAHKEYDWIHIFDNDNSRVQQFAIDGFPTKILIDLKGKIVFRALGEQPADYEKIEKIITQ